MKTRILPGIILGLAAASCAQMQSRAPAPYEAPAAAPQEEVLTNGAGMTLYVFDKDVAGSGKSACSGQCAANWPPQLAGGDSTPFGKYTIVTRDDGAKQWAYNGRPLYAWAKDQKPGDRKGDNFNNAWHIAKP
jgi:predicted lipoprotein with Yx(FWY)xxD motif